MHEEEIARKCMRPPVELWRQVPTKTKSPWRFMMKPFDALANMTSLERSDGEEQLDASTDDRCDAALCRCGHGVSSTIMALNNNPMITYINTMRYNFERKRSY